MNCRNCGGAMDLHTTRGYFSCRYCGSFHFPQTAGADGVRVLTEPSSDAPCPVCRGGLARAVLDEAHSVRYCANCRGVLMSRGTFADVVRMRRSWASGPPAEPVPLQRAELERRIPCPQCQQDLSTHPYYGPGNVVMDSCPDCDVVWLDFGELKQIVDAPGRDRGGRGLPASDPWRPDPLAARPLMNVPADDAGARPRDLLGLIADLFLK